MRLPQKPSMPMVALAFITTAMLAIVYLTAPAYSQTPDVNCSALRGSPMMCVKNASSFPIVAIQAINGNAFNPNSWINIPGGTINPHGTAIVKFNAYSGGCLQSVFVRTASGTTRSYPGVNVCELTSFTIRGW